jgi:PTH1 family peptidyl-tRNA hydrolase
MASSIKAIVGLGNPGPRYFETRHNVGFWFVDALASRCRETFRVESRLQGELAAARLGSQRCWLFKPGTFMNLSGQAVVALASYYKLAADELLIVYDDIDLPPGVARFKSGGGHGGHNGLRDVHRHLGNDYQRLRIGVGHPGHKDEVVDYVLRRPRAQQQQDIETAIECSLDLIERLIGDDRQNAVTALHTELSNKESGKDAEA